MQDHMQSDHLCHRSPQKEEWWVSVHSYFSVRKGFPSSDLKRHLWVSHNLICESWHQHLQIGTIHHLYHSSSFFSATQLWLPHTAEIFGPVPPTATCRLQRTKSSRSPGFPRWNARCSSWSLIQPAGFLLSPSGPAVSGWMPTALAHPPEVNKWNQGFRAPWGELRKPVTGTHHCCGLYTRERLEKFMSGHHMPAQHLLPHKGHEYRPVH